MPLFGRKKEEQKSEAGQGPARAGWLEADEQIVAEFGRVRLVDSEKHKLTTKVDAAVAATSTRWEGERRASGEMFASRQSVKLAGQSAAREAVGSKMAQYLDVEAERLFVTSKRMVLANGTAEPVVFEAIRSIGYAKSCIAGLKGKIGAGGRVAPHSLREALAYKPSESEKEAVGDASNPIAFYAGAEKGHSLTGSSNVKMDINFFYPQHAMVSNAAKGGGFMLKFAGAMMRMAGDVISSKEMTLEFKDDNDKERLDEFVEKMKGDEKALSEYSSNKDLIVREYLHA